MAWFRANLFIQRFVTTQFARDRAIPILSWSKSVQHASTYRSQHRSTHSEPAQMQYGIINERCFRWFLQLIAGLANFSRDVKRALTR